MQEFEQTHKRKGPNRRRRRRQSQTDDVVEGVVGAMELLHAHV
jgi:hypothetical protein